MDFWLMVLIYTGKELKAANIIYGFFLNKINHMLMWL